MRHPEISSGNIKYCLGTYRDIRIYGEIWGTKWDAPASCALQHCMQVHVCDIKRECLFKI
jgi:hypothetical protein